MVARNRWVFRPSTILKRKVIVIYIYFLTICILSRVSLSVNGLRWVLFIGAAGGGAAGGG